MGLLLAFLPFIAFAVLANRVETHVALIVAAALAIVLLARDWLAKHRVKVLDTGTAVLFTLLAGYTTLEQEDLSLVAVRACVDGGLLLIVLFSLAIRQPFTLQYARETVDPKFWSSPIFIRTNYVITAVWALAFAIMTAAEVAMLIEPSIPQHSGFIVVIAALVGAFCFTKVYPERVRAAVARTKP